jgi:hypothetical protein
MVSKDPEPSPAGGRQHRGGASVEVVVEVAGREGQPGRRDCGRREIGLGLGLDAVLYTKETR